MRVYSVIPVLQINLCSPAALLQNLAGTRAATRYSISSYNIVGVRFYVTRSADVLLLSLIRDYGQNE